MWIGSDYLYLPIHTIFSALQITKSIDNIVSKGKCVSVYVCVPSWDVIII